MTERHKKFLNLEEAAAEIVKDLSSSEPEQVQLSKIKETCINNGV